MAESALREKSKEFAKQVVVLCRDIKTNHKESVLTNQLLRSGTSIGANLHEAQFLPKLVGVTGIYLSQPAADILTILVCLFLVKPMKQIAS